MTFLALAALLTPQEVDARQYAVPLDALYDAAYDAALALDLRVDTTTKDGLEGTYAGLTPEGRPFSIRLVRIDADSTRAEVRMDADPSRAARLHAVMAGLTAD